MHFNVYLTLYHLVDVCYFSEKVIFMESVSYYLLCLKSKMSNKRRGKTYVLLNSGLFSEKTLLIMLKVQDSMPGPGASHGACYSVSMLRQAKDPSMELMYNMV